MAKICNECGYPLRGNESMCPECGCPMEQTASQSTSQSKENQKPQQNVTHIYDSPTVKTDWAQYFYECGVIGWKAFNKYAVFNGRASRREYWSFSLIFWPVLWVTSIFGLVILLLPLIGVSVRRMHDINKNGWWSICPFACVFLLFKRSDEGQNSYGSPEPAKNLL